MTYDICSESAMDNSRPYTASGVDLNFCINFFIYESHHKLTRPRQEDGDYVLLEYRILCGSFNASRSLKIHMNTNLDYQTIMAHLGVFF